MRKAVSVAKMRSSYAFKIILCLKFELFFIYLKFADTLICVIINNKMQLKIDHQKPTLNTF